MKVLVTGATGFTGSYTIPILLEKGCSVRCLIRRTSNLSNLPDGSVEYAEGNLTNADSFKDALKGVDAFVSIASLGFGYDQVIIPVLKNSSIKRAVFVSTTSIYTQLNPDSKIIRLRAEELIKNSGLQFTILRPTMIFGSSRDRNICRLIRFINRSPIIPIFGNGEYLQQPVYVGDVAQSIVESLMNEKTINKEYNISGADPLTYNQIVDIIAEMLNKKIKKVYLPYKAFVRILCLFEKVGISLPLKSEQILRLNEHKAFSYEEAQNDFGYNPQKFRNAVYKEIEEIIMISPDNRYRRKL